MKLERYANNYLYQGYATAGEISNGEFVSTMFQILKKKLEHWIISEILLKCAVNMIM